MNDELKLKNNLKEARAEKKLSQTQLAELIGVSRNTISSIETGQFNPTAKLALILCIALDKKPELSEKCAYKKVHFIRKQEDYTMKKFFAIVFMLTLLLSLAACGSDTTASDTDTDTSTPKAEIEDLVEIDIFSNVQITYDGWNEFGTTVEIVTDDCESLIRENVSFSFASDYQELTNGDTVTVTAEYDENVFSENGYKVISTTKDFQVEGLRQITTAQGYHDGVAWVNVRFADETKWCCCDKEGNILFSLDAGSVPTTYYANGVAIVDYNRVVNKSGDVVWSIEEDGTSFGNELWGEGNVKSIEISFDSEDEDYFGYTFVTFSVDSFDLTADITGIIDNTGNWRSEPAIRWYDYSGDGLYEYYVPEGYDFQDGGSWYLYNLLTDETDIDSGGMFKSYNNMGAWQKAYRLEQHNGLIFEWDDYPDTSGFYNADGNKIIDLSGYTLITYADEPEFNEGYSFLEIENDQGSNYYTIIDTTGAEMFAPQKSVEHDKLRCGYYWVNGVGYMNVKGETAFNISLQSGSAFSEDMAAVKTENSNIHYINTNGEIVF